MFSGYETFLRRKNGVGLNLFEEWQVINFFRDLRYCREQGNQLVTGLLPIVTLFIYWHDSHSFS